MLDGKCTVYFFDNIQEETRQRENEESQTIYKYDMYEINPYYRSNLQEDLETNYQIWLEFAKQQEYDKLAQEIRKKRDELLAETDKEMMLDRLKLELPEDITTVTLLASVKQFFTNIKDILNGAWAKYRQELRDIPQQEGFPYEVTFPEKPKINKEESEE